MLCIRLRRAEVCPKVLDILLKSLQNAGNLLQDLLVPNLQLHQNYLFYFQILKEM